MDEVQLDKGKRPAFEADSEDDHFSSTMPTKTKTCSPGSLSLENITEGEHCAWEMFNLEQQQLQQPDGNRTVFKAK